MTEDRLPTSAEIDAVLKAWPADLGDEAIPTLGARMMKSLLVQEVTQTCEDVAADVGVDWKQMSAFVAASLAHASTGLVVGMEIERRRRQAADAVGRADT